MPLGQISGIRPGSRVYPTGKPIQVKVGMDMLGRVLDGLGRPADGHGDFAYEGCTILIAILLTLFGVHVLKV